MTWMSCEVRPVRRIIEIIVTYPALYLFDLASLAACVYDTANRKTTLPTDAGQWISLEESGLTNPQTNGTTEFDAEEPLSSKTDRNCARCCATHTIRSGIDTRARGCGATFVSRVNVASLVLALTVIVGVSRVSFSQATPPEHVYIERQVVLTKNHPAWAYTIVRNGDGYVLAGSDDISDTEAWAMGVDSQGQPRWEFLDGPPNSWNDTRPSDNRFRGAVALSDGSTLLCGSKRLSVNQTAGRLVRLSESGRLLEERYIFPNRDQTYSATIFKCLRWGDGIALVGGASSTDKANGPWLVKLGATGQILWERRGDFGTSDAMEAADHDLLLAALDGTHTDLERVNQRGDVIARRTIEGEGQYVRHVVPTKRVDVGTMTFDGPTRFLHFDQDFQEISPASAADRIGLNRSYELPDQSIVVFGSIYDRGATANIARLDGNSMLRNFPLVPLHEAGWFNDAVESSNPNEFAAVMTMLDGSRPALAWIIIEREIKPGIRK